MRLDRVLTHMSASWGTTGEREGVGGAWESLAGRAPGEASASPGSSGRGGDGARVLGNGGTGDRVRDRGRNRDRDRDWDRDRDGNRGHDRDRDYSRPPGGDVVPLWERPPDPPLSRLHRRLEALDQSMQQDTEHGGDGGNGGAGGNSSVPVRQRRRGESSDTSAAVRRLSGCRAYTPTHSSTRCVGSLSPGRGCLLRYPSVLPFPLLYRPHT